MNDIDLKRLFTRSTFEGLISGKSASFVEHVIRRYIDDPDGKEYRVLISEIYQKLNKSYRVEYYYKNTMLNKLLFQQHNYKTTAVLAELPVGSAKADFVMINGNGVAYEIKTEHDNLNRLEEQIQEYYKAFDKVCVVTYAENVEKIETIVPDCVGIIVLTKRSALKTVRKAKCNKEKLDSKTIFKILRKYEFENIIINQGYKLPKVSQFEYYKKCYSIINSFDIEVFQKLMLKELKKRTKIEVAENCLKTPDELRFLTYFDNNMKLNNNMLDSVLGQRFGG